MSLYSLVFADAPTLSKITKGPFTPPIVLYRIRGWIVVMRGSCISFAMLDGAFKDRDPKRTNDVWRIGIGYCISTARPLASRCGTGSGGSKDSDNLRLRLAALARQADVFLLLPPPTVLRLNILL